MSDRKKSSLELADVVRQFGEPYIEKYQDVILPSQRKALRDIAACQTKALGGQRFQCNDCGKDFWQYHGCRNRSCPKCHGSQIEQWLEKREAEVLPCGYFHSVITVPEELRPVFLKHQKVMYGLLFRVAADMIRELCLDPRHLGAEPALLGVLHTWTGQMSYHPHVHFLVSAGGVTSDGKSWRDAKPTFLVPVKPLSKKIAIEFRRRLEEKHPDLFRQCPRGVWHKSWCSFIKPYGENKEAVVKYLSRYVFRIAITNARLISIDETHVTFCHKDRKTGEFHACRLDGVEFLRRFLLHVLPRGFHKVRYYGLWHYSRRGLASKAWLLLILRTPPLSGRKITIAQLVESISRLTDEALNKATGNDVSECSEELCLDSPRCPHCHSRSTVPIGNVARHGRR